MTKEEKKEAIPQKKDEGKGERKTPPRSKKQFNVAVYHDWCKACGICIAFCPKKVFAADKMGKPVIAKPEDCIGCRMCEGHCPDFAITVSEKTPSRRKTDV